MLSKRLVLFVEGKGDLAAVPTLARRVIASTGSGDALFVDRYDPFTVKGVGTLVKDDCAKWRRWLQDAGKTRPNLGAVLLVLDADLPRVPNNWTSYLQRYRTPDFCPYRVAAMLGHEARSSRAGEVFSLATAFAVKEFEAWFIAGVESLRGISLAEGRGVVPQTASVPDIDIEAKRDAKGLLRELIPGYDQSLDQGILAEKVDLDTVAQRCKSFRRFVHAVQQLAQAVRTGQAMVSPALA